MEENKPKALAKGGQEKTTTTKSDATKSDLIKSNNTKNMNIAPINNSEAPAVNQHFPSYRHSVLPFSKVWGVAKLHGLAVWV